jgi:hypothetical protein
MVGHQADGKFLRECAMTKDVAAVWPPRTEEKLRHAAENGTLGESHTLDIKRELKGGDSGNREIAKDIAAFSLYGEVITIGVDEKTSPPSLHPIELAGLSERIAQVAATRVDEAVIVTTTPIELSSDPGNGFLVVEVPASPRAPHMADGKYYGRADKTNRVLPHAEVLRLHEQQVQQNRDIVAEARETLDRLQTEISFRSAPLLSLAKPLGAHENLLMGLSVSTNWRSEVAQLVNDATVFGHQHFAPSLRNPTGFARRPHGIAATTRMGDGQRFGGSTDAAEITLHEDGTLLLISERAVVYPHAESAPNVLENLSVGHTELVVRLAALVSGYGFAGSWRFAIAVVGLRGSCSYSSGYSYDDLPIYTETRYEQATTATLAELKRSPESVVHALISPLLRSLGSVEKFPWLFELTVDQGLGRPPPPLPAIWSTKN